ncbi:MULTISPECIES: CvpA family protein [Bacillales]|uniref:CvpA family protein n=1 Tax=Lysinibacillus louembei TaxID=1470088 RepID=A0ABZ0RRE8_9BACI|nr:MULTISPECIES: CvpA family protein [Bacillales]MCT6924533.1 CvpA family protein [Metasolibacillus sp.]MCT6940753.1 CvpA family protein [Metasolibacillus sp.]WPK10710.1 CvpA family protein [Lysinibacillus louembei]
MLDIILLVVLFISCIIGAKRGFIVQLIHLGSFLIALIVAYIYYKPLAQKFVLWIPYPGFTENATMTLVLDSLDVDRTFYRVIAFALIFFVTKLVLQIIGSMFDFLTYLPVLGSINRLLGAVLGFIEFYFIIFIALYVLALLPLEVIQTVLNKSILTSLMLEHTPVITKMFQDWWYIYIK